MAFHWFPRGYKVIRCIKWMALATFPFLGVVLGVFVVETFLRIFNFFPYPDRLPPRVFQPDAEIGLSFIPNAGDAVSAFEFSETMRINSLGLRDRLDLSEKDDISIWVIGDSFSEGRGVALDDTYAKRLEVGLGVKVLNLGMASIGTKEEIILLERNLKRFSHPPKIVILGFYTGNDYSDNIRSQGAPPLTASRGYAVDRGRSVMVGEHEIRVMSPEGKELSKIKDMAFHPPFRVGWTFFENTKVYNLAASRLFACPAFRNWCFSHHYASPVKCSLPIGLPGFWDPQFSFENSTEWTPTQHLLDHFIELTRKAGAVPLLAVFPSKFEMDPTLVADYPFEYNPSYVQSERAVDVIVDFCKKRQVSCLDLLREFRRLSKNQQSKLYYSSDAHWRPFGHRIVAEALARKIKSELGDALEARVPR